MKIRRLLLVNYRRHRRLELELPDGVLAIVGANGSGKSSLLEAIGFALFGIQATRTPKALLRHSDAAPSDEVRVELDLELSGQALRVMRSFRGANLTAHAHLEVDGRPLVAEGANSHSAVTQEIERLLGMDRTSFFTSIVAQQKELAKLTELKSQERKQLILRLLGIDAIDRAIEQARDRRRQAQQRVDDLRDGRPDLAAHKQEVAQATQAIKQAEEASTQAQAQWEQNAKALEEAQAHHATCEARDAARRDALELTRAAAAKRDHAEATLIETRQRLDHAIKARKEAEALAMQAAKRPDAAHALAQARKAHHQWETAQQNRATASRIQERLATLPVQAPPKKENPIPAAQERLQAVDAAVAAVQARLADVRAHQQRIDEADAAAPCPFCDQSLRDALPHLHAKLDEQQRDLVAKQEQLVAQQRSAAQHLDAARTQWDAHQKRHMEFDAASAERASLEQELARLATDDAEQPPPLQPLEAALEQAETAERAWIAAKARAQEHDALQAQVGALEDALAKAEAAWQAAQARLAREPQVDLPASRTQLERAQRDERAADEARRNAAHRLELAQQQQGHAKERLAAAQSHHQRLEAARADLRLWTALSGGRDRGLLEQFRRHMVGKIRPAINQEASRLLARFTDGRYRELILDEDYGVFLVEEGVPYALSRFSGGESDLAHLALRLAIGRLLTQRSGAELRFLALDEVFGSLDRQRRDAVLAALHGLEGLYSQIVLVTHQEDLHEALDAVLVVKRDGQGSRVDFHQG
ncbi:MAG: AAA family ATPase [Thermoplasmatota archaeon]